MITAKASYEAVLTKEDFSLLIDEYTMTPVRSLTPEEVTRKARDWVVDQFQELQEAMIKNREQGIVMSAIDKERQEAQLAALTTLLAEYGVSNEDLTKAPTPPPLFSMPELEYKSPK